MALLIKLSSILLIVLVPKADILEPIAKQQLTVAIYELVKRTIVFIDNFYFDV